MRKGGYEVNLLDEEEDNDCKEEQSPMTTTEGAGFGIFADCSMDEWFDHQPRYYMKNEPSRSARITNKVWSPRAQHRTRKRTVLAVLSSLPVWIELADEPGVIMVDEAIPRPTAIDRTSRKRRFSLVIRLRRFRPGWTPVISRLGNGRN